MASCFAVSAQDYLVEYHPNDLLVGTDAIDGGIDVAGLEDGAYAWMVLAGENLYGHVSKIGDTYDIAAVPESDMAATRNVTVGVILFIFFAVMVVVIMYGIFVMREDEREGRNPEDDRVVGPLRYNKVIGRKAAVLSFVGFLAILGVSFYMQTLFALSSQSVANNERAAEVVETTQRTQARMDELISQYDERYLGKARVAGYILDQNPALENRDDLQKLADVLMIQYVFTYDGNGVMTATNSSYANFTLARTPRTSPPSSASCSRARTRWCRKRSPTRYPGSCASTSACRCTTRPAPWTAPCRSAFARRAWRTCWRPSPWTACWAA